MIITHVVNKGTCNRNSVADLIYIEVDLMSLPLTVRLQSARCDTGLQEACLGLLQQPRCAEQLNVS
jgi:hypothetical protein